MKRFLFGFLAVLFLILNTIPYLHILADDMPTSSQYEMLGAYALSTLITSGEATELDFSDYTENDTSFLIDLGEAIFTGDWSGLAEDGLEWLGETADSVYDSYKEYVSQWKSDHLGIMYSYWFPDEEIYVGPDDSYSLAKPLRELLTPRDSNIPIPNPDPNFSFLDNLNNIFIPPFSGSNNYNLFNALYLKENGGQNRTVSFNPSYYSYIGNFIDGNRNYHIGQNLNGVDLKVSVSSPIITINVDSSDSSNVIVTYSPSAGIQLIPNYYVLSLFKFGGTYDVYTNGTSGYTSYFSYTQYSFAGLSSALNYIYQHYANINLYVNGELWYSVSDLTPTYPIVIPGQLTIYNNQPLEYSFPADTHINLPDLTTIIRNAINSSGVVMWSDIADVFVDVNGQTAVAVTKIVRNDYDNLYMEQYPYPAMLVGMTDQTKFNEHLLDNSHAYLSPMGDVVQETVNVLPDELVGVLAIGAILTIFAVIINRLLE